MTGEPGVVWEAQLRVDAVDVHVVQPLNRVVATRPDLVEVGRAGEGRVTVFRMTLEGSARSHRDVGDLVVVDPRLAAVELGDAGAAVSVFRRHAVDPDR